MPTTKTTLQISSATYTVVPGYEIYLIDASSNNVAVTLPVIASNGEYFRFRRIDTSANTVTIAAGAGNTINGGTFTLAISSAVSFDSYGTVWYSIINSPYNAVTTHLVQLNSGGTLTANNFIGSGAQFAESSLAEIIFGKAVTVTSISVHLTVDPTTATSSRTFTIFQDGVTTGSSVTVAAGAQDNSATVSIAFTQYQRLSIKATETNGPVDSYAYVTLQYN